MCYIEEDKNGSLCQKGFLSGAKVQPPSGLVTDGDSLGLVLDIGSVILTARSAGHPGGSAGYPGGGQDGRQLPFGVNGEVCW